MSEYRVALEVYNGPMDLLLYLIQREEVDIHDIPIATITGQYLSYLELLKELDPDGISEFLVLAATLMEIKSRMMLPSPPPEEIDEEITDPRIELVRQLLEYKKFKDAAYHLDQASAIQTLKHPRFPVLPPREEDEVDLANIDIWDLFNAFNRLLEQTGQRDAVHRIGVGIDDTPIALHAADIVDSLERAGLTQRFEDIFAGRSRAEMIGLFLAILELIRQRRIRVTQDEPLGPIRIHLVDPTPLDDIVDTEGPPQPADSNPSVSQTDPLDEDEPMDDPLSEADEDRQEDGPETPVVEINDTPADSTDAEHTHETQ